MRWAAGWAAAAAIGPAAPGDVIALRGAEVELRGVRVVHVGPVSVGYELAPQPGDGAGPEAVHRLMLADVGRIVFEPDPDRPKAPVERRWATVEVVRGARIDRPAAALLAVARLVDETGDAAWAAALPVPDAKSTLEAGARTMRWEIAKRRRHREHAMEARPADAARVLEVLRQLEMRVADLVRRDGPEPVRQPNLSGARPSADGRSAVPARPRTPADLVRGARAAEAAGEPARAAAHWMRLCVLHPHAGEARGASEHAARLLAGPLGDPAAARRVRAWARRCGLTEPGSGAIGEIGETGETRNESREPTADVRRGLGLDGRRHRRGGSG